MSPIASIILTGLLQEFPAEQRLENAQGRHILKLAFAEESPGVAYAFISEEGSSNLRVSLAGKQGAGFEAIDGLSISANGTRVAYIGTRNGSQYAVIDQEVGPAYSEVRSLSLTPDGRGWSYIAKSPDGERVVISGKAGTLYERVRPPRFSRAGQDYAHAVRKQGNWIVVHNGSEIPDWEPTLDPQVSGTEGWVVFGAKHKDGAALVVNGKVVTVHQKIHELEIAPDERSWAAIVSDSKDAYAVKWGQRRLPSMSGIIRMKFSPTSERIAYLGFENGLFHLVVDGEIVKPGMAIGLPPLFSPDGSRVAVISLDRPGGSGRVIVNGQRGPDFEFIDAMTFSPDGKHLAYVGREGAKRFLVFHGKGKSGPYDFVGRPIFSRDGKKLGYCTREGPPVAPLNEGAELWWRVLSIEP